jgi:hypothetical protein
MRYTAGSVVAAAMVALAGGALLAGASRQAVWTGAAIAASLQVAAFWFLFVWALPGQRMLAHMVGMLGRFLAVGLLAFVGVPLLRAPAAPLLLSCVAVLFATTLLEPVILNTASTKTG